MTISSEPDPLLASPIDRAFLGRQTSDDLGLQRELLTLFIEQARTITSRLSQENAHPDARERAAADLHLLKGSARAIGARTVASLAASLEDALAESTNASLTQAHLEHLREATGDACAFAASIVSAI